MKCPTCKNRHALYLYKDDTCAKCHQETHEEMIFRIRRERIAKKKGLKK